MSDKHKRTRTNSKIGALGGFYIVSLFIKGVNIDEIARRCGCSYIFVTQLIGAYLELQKLSFKNEALLVKLSRVAFTHSENEMLSKEIMSDKEFYARTGLDPDNRWWVGKGQNV